MGEADKRPTRGKRPASKRAQPATGSHALASERPPFPIVGVGASAGGLDAFMRVLGALPAKIGLALVLVQHLDPTHESMLAEILGRGSKLPVSEATNGMRVEPDHVYIMPPNVSMSLVADTLKLVARRKPPALVLPIDQFFRSLAEQRGGLAVGVVLSGTGADGTQGLAAIKESGGLTFAQDLDTAEYEGMPRAAVEAGVVDATLDPEGIAAELVRIGRHPRPQGSESGDQSSDSDADISLARIISLVHDATGLDLRDYRKTTLVRRISRRMLLGGVSTMALYLKALQEHPAEIEALYRDVLVNMTEFFRDADSLEVLKRVAFPEIVAKGDAGSPIRIWVPGCSKGQEAYSVAISLVEFLEREQLTREIQMFASDVNAADIEIARAGVYPVGIAQEVSPERLSRFFGQVPGGYRIDRAIREMCVFAVHDVTKDPPFSRLDLVTFRNVLIYMERPLQKRVLQILHYALEPGGFLLLGSSETTGSESSLFSVADKKHRLYRRKPGSAGALPRLAPSSGQVAFAGRTGEGAAFDVLEAADDLVRGSYQPAGMVVNTDLDVLQFRGHLDPFLDPAEGPPQLRLSRLVSPGLSSTVEAAVRDAAKTRAGVSRRGHLKGSEGVRREVDVEVVPIQSPSGESYYLILLKMLPKAAAKGAAAKAMGAAPGARDDEVEALHSELVETREQLEAVIAEKEGANVDLRALGEKLQSGNEELRTINEEFQTAQEELQSTNEELTTLNDELRSRNAELGRLTDDLNNVIEGVEIPILILDADLRISRFTPQAQDVVSITPTDIGRPITDFNLRVDVPDLTDAIGEVLRTHSATKTEVRGAAGNWYSMRIRPYRTAQELVDGVVIAFIDIDELKRSELAAERARDHAEAVVETVREPLLTLGPDMIVREANGAFYQTFATTAEETIGVPIFELGNQQWDFPELRNLLEQVLPGSREFAGLEVEHVFPRIGRRTMALDARRVREEPMNPSILLALEDMTLVRRRESLSLALNDIGATISSTLAFDEVLERVLAASTSALGADSAAAIFKELSEWVVRGVDGLPKDLLTHRVAESELMFAMRPVGVSEPTLVVDGDQAVRFSTVLGLELESCSVLMVPLVVRTETVGMFSFHFCETDNIFTSVEEDFARRLGSLLSVAYENAQLYATQREIATTLQATMLTVPRRIPGVEFGSIYRSATTDARVGGDFYDLFELENGRLGVVVGDVSGKGVRAATLATLVKNTVRALAYDHASPAVVISKTNGVILKATPASIFVTLLFCVLDTASGRLVYCSAGHTRGILKRLEGEIELLGVGSLLAGAFESAEFEDGETRMEPGDTLLMYTDGVTEARRGSELYGEDRLVKRVSGLVATPTRKIPEEIFRGVLDFAGGQLSDDVAIVSVTRLELT